MREIGGYFELDTYALPMLHEEALALNCGRGCLAYLVEAKKIQKIALPYYLCGSISALLNKYGVDISYYHINEALLPEKLDFPDDVWLYLVNYFGQLTDWQITAIQQQHPKTIVDNAQAYFAMPLPGVDTLYTCRKFFGVSDGAFLYTDKTLARELPRDESFERMHFVLGRYDRNAPSFFREASDNNAFFAKEPIKRMSALTLNLLHAVDYDGVKGKRDRNYALLDRHFNKINRLRPRMVEGAYAYPLWLPNGAEIRKKLIEQKIYVAALWPNVLRDMPSNSLEYELAGNVLPMICDQRYGSDEMLLQCEKTDLFMGSLQMSELY